MMKNNRIKLMHSGPGVWFLALISVALFWFSCTNHKKEILGENEFYVCSMDPQVMEKQAGPCPICKMPLTRKLIDKHELQVIRINKEQMELGNIRVDSVYVSGYALEKSLTGVITYNQDKIMEVSSRVEGRIEVLYHKIPGEEIRIGEKLYELYSKELFLAEEEFLLALQKFKLAGPTLESMVNASKLKLNVLGLADEQIKALEKSNKALLINTIYSRAEGTIIDITSREGDYLYEGSKIFKLSDLTSLWVEAQYYPGESNDIKPGREVEIISDNFPGKIMKGTISYINPELQGNSQISLMRAVINMPGKELKPGMQARVIIRSGEKKAIVLPEDAVVQTGSGALVWVENKDGAFSPRTVIVGHGPGNMIDIISGLNVGEKVVISGAYLLYSEYIFKRGSVPHEMNM